MIEWASITISVILSIIAITISIRQYVLFKKAQILRPHSDRIGKVFKSWLESDTFLPEVVDTTNMPEDSIAISVHSLSKKITLTAEDPLSRLRVLLMLIISSQHKFGLKLGSVS